MCVCVAIRTLIESHVLLSRMAQQTRRTGQRDMLQAVVGPTYSVEQL